MFSERPVIALVKLPFPFPSVVLLSVILGVVCVDQHTPLSTTASPPSDVILPPDIADEELIPVTSEVVNSGINFCCGSISLSQAIDSNIADDKITKTVNNLEFISRRKKKL